MNEIYDYEVVFSEEKPIEYELKKIGGIAVWEFNKTDKQLSNKYNLSLSEIKEARKEYQLWK